MKTNYRELKKIVIPRKPVELKPVEAVSEVKPKSAIEAFLDQNQHTLRFMVRNRRVIFDNRPVLTEAGNFSKELFINASSGEVRGSSSLPPISLKNNQRP